MVYLLDNNILADVDWFFKNTDFVLEYQLKIREGGMDIRLLTPKIAERLRELTFDGMLHFAWDRIEDEKKILTGIKLLKEFGFNTRREISIYVLTNFNTSKEEDIYRIKILRDLDVNPFVMIYEDDNPAEKWYRTFARMVNRKSIFWSKTFPYQ